MELWGPQAADPQWLPRQLRALAAYERQVNLVPDEPLVVSDDDSDQGSAHRITQGRCTGSSNSLDSVVSFFPCEETTPASQPFGP